jgi:hypothetical protein
MPEPDSIPVGAILDTRSNDPWANGVQIDHREDMEKLAIRTSNSLYEITIIEGRSGEILLRGGQFFPEFRDVLAGCLQLRSCPSPHLHPRAENSLPPRQR